MKNIIIATALMAVSTASFANHYGIQESQNHQDNKDKTRVEAGIGYYSLETPWGDASDTGIYIGAEHLDNKTRLGYQAGLQGLSYEGTDLFIGDVGVLYDIPTSFQYISVITELGLFHGSIDGSSDTSYYYGVNLKSDIIPEKLDGTIYAKRYDFTYDFWKKSMYGVKLSYKLDQSTYIDFTLEDAGLLSKFGVGFGFYF